MLKTCGNLKQPTWDQQKHAHNKIDQKDRPKSCLN